MPRPRAMSKREKKAQKRFDRMPDPVIPCTREERIFRHRDWSEKRELVRTSLVGIGTSPRTLERFDECGGDSYVYFSASENRYSVRGSYCKCRHCVPCQRSRGNRLAAALKEKLKAATTHQYRFITLTLCHSDTPLKDQIRRLFSAFKTLRNTKEWKASQRGGAFTLEVKWQEKTRRWHPHMHIIAEGEFLRQTTLAALWKKITKDSHVVDIRCLKDGNDAAHYVSKYVSKGTSDNVWKDTNASQEWITAMKGVRVCSTYGTWRGFKLMAKPKIAEDFKPVASLTSIIVAAAAGEEWAMGILLALRPPGYADDPRRPLPVPHASTA
jgi:hypothetical protein